MTINYNITGKDKKRMISVIADTLYEQAVYTGVPRCVYGFNLVDGNLEINEEEAEVVREIFNRYITGEGFTRICADLNARNIRTKRAGEAWKDGTYVAGKWTEKDLSRLIQNEAYIGDLLMQKTYKDRHFKRCANDGVYPQYYAEDHHPGIIASDVFERAQALLATKPKSTVPRKVYPMSGKLICGHCGAPLIRYVQQSTGHVSWVCGRHRRDTKACAAMPVAEGNVMVAFQSALAQVDTMLPGHMCMLEGQASPEVRDLETRLDEKNSSLAQLAGTSADIIQLRNALETEKLHIQTELERTCDPRIAETEELMKCVGSSSFVPEEFQRVVDTVTVDDAFAFHFRCGIDVEIKAAEKAA